jgi:hypothetical protein
MPIGKFRSKAVAAGYRSGLEEKVGAQLHENGVEAEYEPFKIPYVVPVTKHAYTPDYVLPNGIVIETKGRFVIEDRKKHILLKEQYPDLDLRFVFQNAKAKIRKGSPTSYGDWCTKHGFRFSSKTIPTEWLEEKTNKPSLKIISTLRTGK